MGQCEEQKVRKYFQIFQSQLSSERPIRSKQTHITLSSTFISL
jgi:hypothetical protein